MLRITTNNESNQTSVKLEGKLSGPWVVELQQCWEQLRSSGRSGPMVIDLSAVNFIDSSGKDLLTLMHTQGATLIATGCLTKSVVEEITRPSAQRQKKPGHGSSCAVFFLLLGSFLIGRSAQAQQEPALRLTLQSTVQMAMRQNPQVQIANLNMAQSERDRDVALSGLLPQFGLEVSDEVQRYNREAFLGQSIPFLSKAAGPFQVFQAGGGFSHPVFDLTLWRRWQASKRGVKAAGAGNSSVREQTVLLVVSQYLGGLRAAANVRAAQSRVNLAQALYDQAFDLQKNGVGTGLDTLRANVQLQNEKQRLIVAQAQQKTSLYGLAKLLNLDPQTNLEQADEVSFFETPKLATEQTLELAFVSRPEIQALEARQQIVQLQKRGASESSLPKVMANGHWGYQGLSVGSSISTYLYQVTLDVPLFTGGRIRAEKAKADLELKKVDQEQQELRSVIALQVRTAMVQLESARNEVDVANLAVKLADEEVTQSRDRFQAGVTNNIEVISAQDALARANDNQIGALYRYNQARADLAHATGQIEKLYAK